MWPMGLLFILIIGWYSCVCLASFHGAGNLSIEWWYEKGQIFYFSFDIAYDETEGEEG